MVILKTQVQAVRSILQNLQCDSCNCSRCKLSRHGLDILDGKVTIKSYPIGEVPHDTEEVWKEGVKWKV